MKNFYYNPKTRDLTIFDTESKEMLVLERIEGVRVLTSSEIDRPTNFTDSDPARPTRGKKADNSFAGSERGFSTKRKVKKCGYCHSTEHRGKDCPKKPKAQAKRGGSGKRAPIICSVCGKPGRKDKHNHGAELPEKAVDEIAREEREPIEAVT